MMNQLKKVMPLIPVDPLKTDDDNMTEIEGKIPRITGVATTASLIAVKNEIFKVVIQSKKQNMMQKYQTLKKYILLLLIIINLLVKYFMQR